MDRESFEYMKAEYQQDLLRLKEEIRKELSNDNQEFLSEQERKNAIQLQDAQKSPVYQTRRKQVVKKTIEEQKFAQSQNQFEQRTEFKTRFEERRHIIESAHFMEFGGSLESAREQMNLFEKNQKASENLNKEWEHNTKEGYEAAKQSNDNSREGGLTQDFDRAIEPSDGGMER